MSFSDLSAVNWISIYSAISLFVHGLGILNAGHAVMNVQSSRAAVAWSISLVTFPWAAIPLYWVFGKDRFHGYAEAIRKAYSEHHDLEQEAYDAMMASEIDLEPAYDTLEKLANSFESFPFTGNNETKLLVNGHQTFEEMLGAIATAKRYILLQSYIIHSDDIGNRFKDALVDKAKQGVKVFFLFDGLGSHALSRSYINELHEHGIKTSRFRSTKGIGNRFQINFRNHRKILVVDGETAFMGGLNIGDEYLGRDPKLGSWRDTHVRFRGSSVLCLQEILLRDWYWATKEVPDVVSWEIPPSTSESQKAFIFSTGPADELKECMLFFLNLINRCQERLWIASPYFVPDESTLNALKLAALRGVDVRIILPNSADHLSVYLCAFSFYDELKEVGIQLYRYKAGFMHQKVILCDSDIAGVGTINLDNRSFYLNFEVMSFVIEPPRSEIVDPEHSFVQSVERMLQHDFEASKLVDYEKYAQKPFWFKLAARIARLLAPIL